MADLSDDMRQLAIAGFRLHNPDLDEVHARGRMLKIVLGEALYEAACTARGLVA